MGDITKVRKFTQSELPVSQDIGAFCAKILPDIEIGNVNYKIRNILEFCITHIISKVSQYAIYTAGFLNVYKFILYQQICSDKSLGCFCFGYTGH